VYSSNTFMRQTGLGSRTCANGPRTTQTMDPSRLGPRQQVASPKVSCHSGVQPWPGIRGLVEPPIHRLPPKPPMPPHLLAGDPPSLGQLVDLASHLLRRDKVSQDEVGLANASLCNLLLAWYAVLDRYHQK
jgi:hypothetical protein